MSSLVDTIRVEISLREMWHASMYIVTRYNATNLSDNQFTTSNVVIHSGTRTQRFCRFQTAGDHRQVFISVSSHHVVMLLTLLHDLHVVMLLALLHGLTSHDDPDWPQERHLDSSWCQSGFIQWKSTHKLTCSIWLSVNRAKMTWNTH